MAHLGTLCSFSAGLTSLGRHIILLTEALYAAAGCILLSFAAGLLKTGVATTCINIRLSDGLHLTIHDFGVPWNCVSRCIRQTTALVFSNQEDTSWDASESSHEAWCLSSLHIRANFCVPSSGLERNSACLRPGQAFLHRWIAQKVLQTPLLELTY